MKKYELNYLISPEFSEEEAKEFQNKIASFFQEEEGVLNEEGSLIRIKLAYPIKKQTQAYLAVLSFQLKPEKLSNLEKKLKEENQILRYLLLIKKEIEIKPGISRIPPISRKSRKAAPKKTTAHPSEKKVELKEIEKKLEEILNEPK